MSDSEQRIEQYQIAAAECEMISLLATTDFRRDMYELVASQYRQLAEDRRVEDLAMTLTAQCG